MPKHPNPRRQMEQKHPEPWRQDLNPDHMAGQNIGGAEEHERMTRTAYDVKSVHRALDAFTDDELKQIPILEPGTRLRIGAKYLDLDQGELTVGGELEVRPGQKIVPKDAVHYETWHKLLGTGKG